MELLLLPAQGSIWTAAVSPLSGGLEENSIYPFLLSFCALFFLLRTRQEIIYSLCFDVDDGFFQLKRGSVLELPVQSPKIPHAE